MALTKVTSGTITDSAVTAAKIADGTVVAAEIADDAIVAAKIADDAVTTAKIADANITTALVADDAVTTAKIADVNITTALVADDAVTTAKIADANITTALVADDAITTAKIAPDAITAAEIADNAVTTAKINANAVTTVKINGDAITGAKIADNAIGSEHLEDDTVGIAELSASGTASSSTFLRGDNSWAAPGGGAFKQIVEVSATTWGATTSSSYVDIAGIGASITTTGGNSTVMVQIYTGGQVSHPGIRGFAAIQNYTASSSTQFEESAIVIGDNDSGSPAQKSFSNGCITHTFTGLAAQTWNFRGRWRMHAPNGSFNNSRAQGTIILWELA